MKLRDLLDLTVVIPAHNAGRTVTRAINSAHAAGAAEVIVVDDGSGDGTAEVAHAAGARVITQENTGASKARLVGAAEARGKYLVFLDADDELVPEGVRRSVLTLENNVNLVVSAGVVITVAEGQKGRRSPIRYAPVNTETLLEKGYGPWPPAAAVVRAEALAATRKLEPPALAPQFADDYELLIRLSLIGAVGVRDDPTCRYSMVGGKSAVNAEKAIAAKEAVRRHYGEALGLRLRYMSDAEIRMAAIARVVRARWSAGRHLAALGGLAKWFFVNPIDAFRQALRRSGLQKNGREWK
jgi:glycosyltransferase involved in cell wall biosynthesis